MEMGFILAEVLTDPSSVGGAVERLGVAGILVIGLCYLLKYFMAQLEKRDTRIVDLTERFILATINMTKVTSDTGDAIESLTKAVDRLQERSGIPPSGRV